MTVLHSRWWLTAALLPLVVQHPLTAQRAGSPSTPAATVDSFWRATLSMRWGDAVQYLRLSDLESARRVQLESAKLRPGREYTVEDLMRRDPEMPREAAEYEVLRRAKQRQQYPPRPFGDYFGFDSAAQLERVPIEDLAVRWIQAHDPLWPFVVQTRVQKCPRSAALDTMLAGRRAMVYGEVFAGQDTAYVVFKVDWFPWPDLPASMPDMVRPANLAVLLRDSTGWHIRAVEELFMNSGGVGLYGIANCPPP